MRMYLQRTLRSVQKVTIVKIFLSNVIPFLNTHYYTISGVTFVGTEDDSIKNCYMLNHSEDSTVGKVILNICILYPARLL